MSEENEDWVIAMLADAPRPELPPEVANRLATALRAQIDADAGTPAIAETSIEAQPETPTEPVTDTSPRTQPEAPAPVLVPSRRLGSPGRSWGSRRELRAEDQGERRRQLLTRWLPVAAGVLVLGGAGVTALSLQSGQDDATSEAGADDAGAVEAAAPRALVATGTQYTTSDNEAFQSQIRDLVMTAASGEAVTQAQPEAAEGGDTAADDEAESDQPAQEESMSAMSGAPGPADVSSSPLADRAELQRCVDEVTAGASEPPTAVDLAIVDGALATIVVVPDPAGQDLLVYVVGPDCTETRYDFFTVTP